MTKIKNFRIQLRNREVARLLKARLGGVPLDPTQESSLEPALAECRPLVHPAALYATLTRQTTVHAVPFELPKKAVAFSTICITIGATVGERLAQAQGAQNTARACLLECIEQEALQQAMAFALRLVQDQAKKEDCELTETQECQEPESRRKIATLLDLQRIGLTLTEPEASLPAHARLVYVVWMPVGKSSARKKTPAKSRAEKAAL